MDKVYLCKRINNKSKINGDFNKVEWSGINTIILCDNTLGEIPKLRTFVKVAYDDDFLYVIFKCEDDYKKALKTKYNDKLYEEDVVEIFIDDNNDLKTYIEIEVNPLNTILHYSINNNLKGNILGYARVEEKINSAIINDGQNGDWSVEIAVPFSEFATPINNPPKVGDKWHMNLYRIDRGQDSTDEYSAWCPTGKTDFHRPEYFGKLVFD